MSTAEPAMGFLSHTFTTLGSPGPILLGIILLLFGLFFSSVGARSLAWGATWGKTRGTEIDKAHIPGGIGGIIFGAMTTSSLAALLIALVVSKQDSPSLGSVAALAILICSSIPGAVLGAKFELAARIFVGLLGGTAITLLIITSIRPSSLLARDIFWLCLIVISIALCLVPKTMRSMAVFSAAFGAYLIVLGIDMFVKLGFLDLLSLFVHSFGASTNGKESVTQVIGWEGGKFRGLLAGWWLMTLVFSTGQFYLGGIGSELENSWNNYVGQLSQSYPDRRGTFVPHKSIFSRLFGSDQAHGFTNMPDARARRRQNPWDDEKAIGSDDWDDDLVTLAGERSEPARYNKVKEEIDAESDDEATSFKPKYQPPSSRLLNRKSAESIRAPSVMSGDTLFDSKSESGKKKYNTIKSLMSDKSQEHRSLTQADIAEEDGDDNLIASPSSNQLAPPPPPNAVPATPSLINALNRIKQAQHQARGKDQKSSPPREDLIPRRMVQRERGASWDHFWKDVVDKGGQDGSNSRS